MPFIPPIYPPSPYDENQRTDRERDYVRVIEKQGVTVVMLDPEARGRDKEHDSHPVDVHKSYAVAFLKSYTDIPTTPIVTVDTDSLVSIYYAACVLTSSSLAGTASLLVSYQQPSGAIVNTSV